jgi:hypothetical protein
MVFIGQRELNPDVVEKVNEIGTMLHDSPGNPIEALAQQTKV